MSKTAEQIRASGKTYQVIAAEVEVNPTTAWRWMRGEIEPEPKHLAKLAKALGCRPADLRPDIAALFREPRCARGSRKRA